MPMANIRDRADAGSSESELPATRTAKNQEITAARPDKLLHAVQFFLSCTGHHRDLHSFPTRRSSDLGLMKLYFAAQMQLAPNPDLVDQINRMTQRPSFLLRRGVETEFLCPTKRDREKSDKDLVIGFEIGRAQSELQSQFHLVCRLLLE